MNKIHNLLQSLSGILLLFRFQNIFKRKINDFYAEEFIFKKYKLT